MGLGMKLYDYLHKKYKDVDIENMGVITGDMKQALYFKALAYYIGVSYIASTISKCEFKVMREGKETKNDLLYYYLNVRPNPNQSAAQFKSDLIFKLYYDNESLIFLQKNQLFIADSYQKEYHPLTGDVYQNIALNNETRTFTRPADQVMLFRLDDKNIHDLVTGMLEDYRTLLATAVTAYEHGNYQKYKINLSQINAGNKDFQEEYNSSIKGQLKDFLDNPFAVYPQFQGRDLVEMCKGSQSSSEVQAIRKDMFELAAQALKMPASMLYGNVTNYKDVLNGWASVVIEPLAKMLGEVITGTAIPYEDWQSGDRVMVDTTMLFHLDFFDICEKSQFAISSGVFNIDDVRDKVGDPLLDTDFSKQHWMSKNNDRIENLLSPQVKE